MLESRKNSNSISAVSVAGQTCQLPISEPGRTTSTIQSTSFGSTFPPGERNESCHKKVLRLTSKSPREKAPLFLRGFFVNISMSKWVHRMIELDMSSMTGQCANCGPVELHLRTMRGKQVPRCSNAVMQQRASTNRNHGGVHKKPHGLTAAEARAFLHGKHCSICGSQKQLCVDHCHKTGKLRGALCLSCNGGLGFFYDDPQRLQAAIAYLAGVERQNASR